VPDNTPNYPDILGYVTGGPRASFGVVQTALAVRPRVVRAGRVFETIILIQNASDSEVDAEVTLHLPELDAKKKKGRFVTKTGRLVVGLRPSEVGYVTLPVSCLPDTAVSDSYKLSMNVESKPQGKPRRVRGADGGGDVTLSYLSQETRDRLEELKKLTFSTAKSGLLGSGIEVGFSVMSGSLGQIVNLKPEWVSLWTLSDHLDDRLLLERYRDMLLNTIIPALNRSRLLNPLLEETQLRFVASGYKLKPVEALVITKLLMHILEMASPREDAFDYLSENIYNLSLLLKKGIPSDGTPDMPHWCRALLYIIARDERVASHPEQAITRLVYGDLIRDAALHAFNMIKTVSGENLGSEADMEQYAEQLGGLLNDKKQVDFTHVYMPLMLGGVILFDRIVTPGENVGDTLVQMSTALDERGSERNPDTELIFTIAEQLLSRALQKYGGYRP